jgi:YD repeat-containing protein
VTSAGGSTYSYDANGNMITRTIGGQTWNLAYDAGNRLVSVSGPNNFSASFVYDGNGARVKSTIGGVSTTGVGSHYEVSGSTVTTRIAMRQGSDLYYLLSDHLGSTSLTTDASGTLVATMLYKPWGETRYTSGTSPTEYTFQGQYRNVADSGPETQEVRTPAT